MPWLVFQHSRQAMLESCISDVPTYAAEAQATCWQHITTAMQPPFAMLACNAVALASAACQHNL